MLISYPQFPIRIFLLAVVPLGLVLTSRAAQTPAATSSAPAQPEVPKSVFHFPTSPQDAVKDPFFPQSTRLRGKPPQLVIQTNVPPPVVELELKGISGTVERRLAIIASEGGSRTFAVGEEGELPTGRGKARIRVLEIKDDSAVVTVNGKQEILKLRPGL